MIHSKELAAQICKWLAQKNMTNIVTIDVEDKTSVTNYFVVCTARNATVAKTAAEYLEDHVRDELGSMPDRKDGEREGRWIVLDYGLVIVHIFHSELRDFYAFEKLWSDPDGGNVQRYEE